MKEAQKENCKESCPALRVIRGGKSDLELDRLSQFAWSFTCSMLFPHLHFSEMEVDQTKALIKSWILSSTDKRKGFTEFCERVILFKEKEVSYLKMLPSVWMNVKTNNGFAVSTSWLEYINLTRQSIPAYRQDIKALAEAILETSESPTENNFRYWRHFFINQHSFDALQILMNYSINLHFNIY